MPSWMYAIKSSPHGQVLSDTAVGYFFIWIWLLYDLKLCEFLKMIKETITFDNWKWKCYDNYKVWGLMSKKSTSNCEKINSSFQHINKIQGLLTCTVLSLTKGRTYCRCICVKELYELGTKHVRDQSCCFL